MKRISYCFVLLLIRNIAFCQGFNANADNSFVNIDLPKTPESEGIQRYGMIPVNEVNGQPNISFPLYTFKSRFLEVPITLSYDASGIRVNQEATQVGLGFNLLCGGRITLEVRGNADAKV